ncbi:hypothetical protein HYH03_004880 [Edaphochlamys debaryana]|uniref:Uncharacterized protein n=1 Tax=Edaphochlamys debaryana TaxID=47281 RepID=A0A835Y6M9_9CHLO|nr:hypothetical protein HYH03_004880 [Edaphochlamys debaryana]|eukprot:KAG2497297.1 hypothetical protein HYH03_004880 [Edaphochlamys debaryana]
MPVLSIYYNNTCCRMRVRPGPDGLQAFLRQLEAIVGRDVSNINYVFRCRCPDTGAEIFLQGLQAFEAAMHCACVRAAQRSLQQQQQLAAQQQALLAYQAQHAPQQAQQAPQALGTQALGHQHLHHHSRHSHSHQQQRHLQRELQQATLQAQGQAQGPGQAQAQPPLTGALLSSSLPQTRSHRPAAQCDGAPAPAALFTPEPLRERQQYYAAASAAAAMRHPQRLAPLGAPPSLLQPPSSQSQQAQQGRQGPYFDPYREHPPLYRSSAPPERLPSFDPDSSSQDDDGTAQHAQHAAVLHRDAPAQHAASATSAAAARPARMAGLPAGNGGAGAVRSAGGCPAGGADGGLASGSGCPAAVVVGSSPPVSALPADGHEDTPSSDSGSFLATVPGGAAALGCDGAAAPPPGPAAVDLAVCGGRPVLQVTRDAVPPPASDSPSRRRLALDAPGVPTPAASTAAPARVPSGTKKSLAKPAAAMKALRTLLVKHFSRRPAAAVSQ